MNMNKYVLIIVVALFAAAAISVFGADVPTETTNLRSGTMQKKLEAVHNLGAADDAVAAAALLKEYPQQKDLNMKIQMVESLGHSRRQDRTIRPALEKIMNDVKTPKEVRQTAIQSISQLGGAASVNTLAGVFANQKEDIDVRMAAGAELGLYLTTDKAFITLRDSLKDTNPRIREQAVCSLGLAFSQIMRQRVTPLLQAMQSDSNAAVAARAGQMLEVIRPKVSPKPNKK